MFEVNGFDHVNAKVEALTQKINNLTITTPAIVAVVAPNYKICEVWGHMATDCLILTRSTPYHVSCAQWNPYSNNYNPRWRNHPNFSYKNNNKLFALSPPSTNTPSYQKGIDISPHAPRK